MFHSFFVCEFIYEKTAMGNVFFEEKEGGMEMIKI